MRHTNLPPTPAFLNASVNEPIQEIALRVIVELPGWEFYGVGTAVLIGGHLAVTAKHVLEAVIRKFGAKSTPKGVEVGGYSLRLYQVLRGPLYRIWNVFSAWISSSDIAILHLGLDATAGTDRDVQWRSPALRIFPPPSGQKVLAFGYRESRIDVSEDCDGVHHIKLDDVPTTSIGEVGQIFTERRDSSMLAFPCFEVIAQFAPGMSGGLVIDEEGVLCGLVCASCVFSDPHASPLSYAATLWPMLGTRVSADRGDKYLRGVEYPMLDLAVDDLIHVVDLDKLDTKLLPQ